MKTNTTEVQQLPLQIPKPQERGKGWLKYHDRVIFVILDNKGVPRIRTGHVCSWPGSHGAGFEVDNVSKTVVWCNHVLNDLADDADDAHEKSFNVKDPCLLKLSEIKPLRNSRKAVEWFNGVYPRKIAIKIANLLSTPYFGLHEEAKEKAVADQKLSRRLNLNLRHWQKHRRPHPIYGKVGMVAHAV